MKTVLSIFIFFLCFQYGSTQFSCESIHASPAAMKNYSDISKSSLTGGLVKIYFHVYNNSSGFGGVPLTDLDVAVTNLNTNFQGTGFSFFYNPCETEIINDTGLHNSADECDFFFQGAPADGINIHVKGDGAQFSLIASGIPGNEILIGGLGFGVQFLTSGVMSHEMGHCLGLFHTFQGHCPSGGTDCNGVTTNNPLDPAGDLVDDTDPDRNTSPWNVTPGSCVWNGQGNTTCDMTITSSPTDNFMAYTHPTCMSVFSQGQSMRMCMLALPEVIHTSTFACCEIEDLAPTITGDAISNDCPKDYVDLIDLFTGNIPAETTLVWSEDDDPSNGIVVLPGSVVSTSGIYYAYFYNVDNDCYSLASTPIEVKIEDCCSDPIPDYVIVDENGNPRTDFCVGDPVFLNACGSIDATSYFLGIWEYELGGYAAGESNVGYSRLDPSWSGTAPGCMINLEDIWANFESYKFRAGHEYRIQFAVDNECTSSWHAKEDGIFTMAFPTPDYLYVDENGSPKDVFCLGETVYMDGSATIDESKYYIGLWQYNIGGFLAGEQHLGYSRIDPTWAQGQVGSLINLNEIWANFEQDYFSPGFEYRVQLAVRGECDLFGWNVKEDELFTVICCEDQEVCEADFTVSTEEDGHGNIFFDFNSFDEIYYNHTWTVFEHDEQGTGPYTTVATSTDPYFNFTGTIGGCYTIVHEVETPCGSCCYAREICNDKEEGLKGEGLKVSSSAADCDILCNILTPEGLGCSINGEGYLVLNWDEVNGADGYIVSLNFNDADCCGGHGLNMPYNIEAETNSVTLQFYPICMSWTVTAKCADGNGQTSEKVCFNYLTGCGDHVPKLQEETDTRSSVGTNTSLEVYPNPASEIIHYNITIDEGDAIRAITLVDMNGRMVENVEFELTEERIVTGSHQLQNELSGIYFIRVQLDKQVITKKIMIVR